MPKLKPYFIVYSDDSLLAVNKASGLLVAQDRYDVDAPRLDLILNKDFGKLWALHRIDKDTSGLVIYARTSEAHRNISLQFQNRVVKKKYLALVYGRPLWNEKKADAPLLVDGDARHRTIVHKQQGKKSLTEFVLKGSCASFSWIEARPITGRTHQIRAHLRDLGFSILCDPLYGGNQRPFYLSDIKRSYKGDRFEEQPLVSRLALHALSLELIHPETNESLFLEAPLAKDMDIARKQCEKLFKFNLFEK